VSFNVDPNVDARSEFGVIQLWDSSSYAQRTDLTKQHWSIGFNGSRTGKGYHETDTIWIPLNLAAWSPRHRTHDPRTPFNGCNWPPSRRFSQLSWRYSAPYFSQYCARYNIMMKENEMQPYW